MRILATILLLVIASLRIDDASATSTYQGQTYSALMRLDHGILYYSAKSGGVPQNQVELEKAVKENPEIFGTNLWKDSWGRNLIYRQPGNQGRLYDLYSVGSNGIDDKGTQDDVVVWEYRGYYVSRSNGWGSVISLALLIDGPLLMVLLAVVYLRRKWREA